jgi:hypothetical protein
MPLITTSVERLANGMSEGYLAGIIYLAPEQVAGGGINVCKFATDECKKVCLNTSGRGQMSNVQEARIARTRFYWNDRDGFYNQVTEEVHALERKAKKMGLKPAIRLNGTSDLDHRAFISLFNELRLDQGLDPLVWYDYTKHPTRALTNRDTFYHFTYSHGGIGTMDKTIQHVEAGVNATVVFATKKGHPLPAHWNGFKVIDGDLHDLRFLDPKGVIVGLRAKGKAKKVQPAINGFVNPDLST